MLYFLYTEGYDDLEVPDFGSEVCQAPESLTTGSPSDPSTTSSHMELATPLTRDDDTTSMPRWARSAFGPCARSSPYRGDIKRLQRRLEIRAKRAPDWAEQRKIGLGLEKNAQVYICADKLDLKKLKKLAASKFKERLWSIADTKDTYPALRLAYENTSEDDTALRHETMRYCIHENRRIEAFPKFAALLKEHEPTAWKLAVEVQRERVEEGGSLEEKLKPLDKKKVRAERRKVQAEQELESVVQLVNGERLMSGSRCTAADMKLDIQTNQIGTKQYRLICKCCDKQHDGVYITPREW